MTKEFTAYVAQLRAQDVKIWAMLSDGVSEERVIYEKDGVYKFRSVVEGDPEYCAHRDDALSYPTLRAAMEFVIDDFCTCFEG